MHTVLLVNRALGTSQALYPVSGKSGKLYGQATLSTEKGGVAFEMSMEEYEKAAFDIVGNDSPMQRWVPFFIQKVDRFADTKINELRHVAKALGYKGPFLSRVGTIDKIKELEA
jgi:hypothetical protein